jgi:tetratricopeptide (TPR) repeat protein
MESKTVTAPRAIDAQADSYTPAKSRLVVELQNRGEYEAACEALGGFWRGIGQRPEIGSLSAADQAEVLLRVGTLSGWLGSSGQIPGAQEFAKDLISESLRAFEALGDQEKVAEAQCDLAICYWREGALDEGRVWFKEALSRATIPVNKLRILVNRTTVELSSNRLQEALSFLEEAAPLLDCIDDPAAVGRFHMQKALVLRNIGGSENIDRALIENAAASINFEQANHRRYFARVENNIGFIFLELGRYEEALQHLDRALSTFIEIDDVGTAAQVNETRARVFLAQGQYIQAEKIAFTAVSTFESGGESTLLAEALEAQGIALARMGRRQNALAILERATHIAETAGNPQMSAKIRLTILEEVSSLLSPNEIRNMYQEADQGLGEPLSLEVSTRLRACARLLTSPMASSGAENLTIRGSFEEEVHKRESELIKSALDEAKGSVTRAARSLGLTHQGLCYIINHRHQQLLGARAPIRVRRKSIIKKR